jgi:hypothetical protein
VITIIVALAMFSTLRYFQKRQEYKHEKEMLREKRDAELLTEDSYIEQELEREKNE